VHNKIYGEKAAETKDFPIFSANNSLKLKGNNLFPKDQGG
jgi:hypothetical protein